MEVYQESSNPALSCASGRVSSHIIYSTAIARPIHIKASSINPFIRLSLQTALAARNLSTQTSHLSRSYPLHPPILETRTPRPQSSVHTVSPTIPDILPQPVRTIDEPYARSLHGSCLRKPVHGGIAIFKGELERLHCPVRPIQGMDVVSLVQWGFVAHVRGLVELGDECGQFQPSSSLLVSQFESVRILITTAKLLPCFHFCIPKRRQVCPEKYPPVF